MRAAVIAAIVLSLSACAGANDAARESEPRASSLASSHEATPTATPTAPSSPAPEPTPSLSADEAIALLSSVEVTVEEDYDAWCGALYRASGIVERVAGSTADWDLDAFAAYSPDPASGYLGQLNCNVFTEDASWSTRVDLFDSLEAADARMMEASGYGVDFGNEQPLVIDAPPLVTGLTYAVLGNELAAGLGAFGAVVTEDLAPAYGVESAVPNHGAPVLLLRFRAETSGLSKDEGELLVKNAVRLTETLVAYQPSWEPIVGTQAG